MSVPHRVLYPAGWRLSQTVSEVKSGGRTGLPSLEKTYLASESGRRLPDGADGFVMIPKLSALARHDSAQEGLSTSLYRRAFQVLLRELSARAQSIGWEVDNYIDHDDGAHLKLREMTSEAFRRLEIVRGEAFVVPVQLGLRFGGMAPGDVVENLPPGQFPLDPVSVGWIVYSEMLAFASMPSATPTLYIDCPGAMYAPQENGKFLDTPRIEVDFVRRLIRFDWNWQARARRCHGTATFWGPV